MMANIRRKFKREIGVRTPLLGGSSAAERGLDCGISAGPRQERSYAPETGG